MKDEEINFGGDGCTFQPPGANAVLIILKLYFPSNILKLQKLLKPQILGINFYGGKNTS